MANKLQFSTKANTLKDLTGLLTSAAIAPLFSFSTAYWLANRDECLEKISLNLGNGPWIVRSSCNREDGKKVSNAGKFLSILNVEKKALSDSIDKVIASFGDEDTSDEVLVQPMLTNVIKSGVAFSHDPNTCSPYRIVNWQDGEDTSIVTGGMAAVQTWQQAANVPKSAKHLPNDFDSVSKLTEELLILFGGKPLDLEFAITKGLQGDFLWLLQVRPLILKFPPETPMAQQERLEIIEEKLKVDMKPHPFLMGKRTIYGVMPDWNPAEIIGIRPKPLALSLYRELITDNIWAYQRHNYGYRNLRSFPLMRSFFGLPYIDVRLSFNSFIPADLDEKLAGKLVDYYIDRLETEPTLHDKVEFEIVFSCYTLDLPQRLDELSAAGFSLDEIDTISGCLRKLTNRILDPVDGLWKKDAAKLQTLDLRRKDILGSNVNSLERIYWLLEDGKRYGTLPFAGLARAGFIAVQMLKSLIVTGVFSQADDHNFLASISTISSQMSKDRSELDKKTFLEKYGHLRPGTYDILSFRYDEKPNLYFNWEEKNTFTKKQINFSLSKLQMSQIELLLETNGLRIKATDLIDFIKNGIELRELAKFYFTKNLSSALDIIYKFGTNFGFERNDIAFSNIKVYQELYIKSDDSKKVIEKSIVRGKSDYAQTLKVSLPALITKPSDVWAFQWTNSAPNFITQKEVTAPVVGHEDIQKLPGSIVYLPNADPGFDWLFSYSIAGLITAWGGANSHMSIRAGEIGLPAVIGAGEAKYNYWSQAQILFIDCANKTVRIIK